VIYKDEAKGPQTKGLNKDFGFHVNRPFYFRSRMPFHRVMAMHGNSHMYIQRWKRNNNPQMFWFDPVSKTIRNQHWKGHAITLPGNGNSRGHVRTAGVTSRWW
jgi:hypothetical protein